MFHHPIPALSEPLKVSEPLPTWPLQEAKNRFSAVVKADANGPAQFVTVHGALAAVVLSPAAYERLVAVAPPAQRLSELLLCPGAEADDESDLFARDRRHNSAREPSL